MNLQAGPANTKTYLLWSGMVIVLMMIISMPTVIVLSLGMLPTMVARLIDRTEEHFASFCVGGLNMCGVFPYVLKLWTKNHTIGAATEMTCDVFVLATMYAAAGFGWLVYLSIPPVISAFLSVIAQRRMASLRSLQREIVDEWGPSVAAFDDGETPGGIEPFAD